MRFEGLRAILIERAFAWNCLLRARAECAYLALGVTIFLRTIHPRDGLAGYGTSARRHVGE